MLQPVHCLRPEIKIEIDSAGQKLFDIGEWGNRKYRASCKCKRCEYYDMNNNFRYSSQTT